MRSRGETLRPREREGPVDSQDRKSGEHASRAKGRGGEGHVVSQTHPVHSPWGGAIILPTVSEGTPCPHTQ